MKRIVVLVAIFGLLAVSCVQNADVNGGPDGVGVGNIRFVAVDGEGNCYISRPKGGSRDDTFGDFKFFGDCQTLFRDGWE